jgi:rfaE bifunctional protein nucleotidyltransferase chain/domain
MRVRAGGRALVRLDRGGAGAPCGPLTAAARAALGRAAGVLVADYGRGLAAAEDVRAALAAVRGDLPVVWDPHPRGPAPVAGVLLATPNAAEAARMAPGAVAGAAVRTDPTAGGAAGAAASTHPAGGGAASTHPADDLLLAETRGRALAHAWRAVDVCVTLGERGAVLVGGGAPALVVPAPRAAAGDPCGAGDCFAATAAGALADGELPSGAVRAAVAAASAFVAAGGAAEAARHGFAPSAPAPAHDDAAMLAARVRAQGGRVVATGGCFDLLHAGHVRTLEAARTLGDCLIVCVNSDASVRRLKGPERPIVGEEERATLLRALGCVDAVAIFGEDDPRSVLRTLRPHLWAKGGDYAASELPETPVLAEWGGRAVIVPYVPGRSTTRLIETAVGRAR